MDYSVFAKRLTDMRKKAGLTQSALAELVGLSRQTLVRWEGGDTFPDIRDVTIVANALHTSVAYLIGEIEDTTPSDQTRTGDKHPDVESNVRMGGKFIEIPLLTMATAASCGLGNGLYGVIPESSENIFVEAETFQYLDESRKPFAVPIEGDSMIGAGLEEGASAVINPADEVMNGDAALVSCDGSWMIKWVVFSPDGSVELRPANPNYTPTRIEAAYASDPSWFRIIGKVVATVKKSVPKRAF